MTAIIIQILEIIIIPIIGALCGLLIAYINKKTEEINKNIENSEQEKYLKLLQSAVEDAVQAVNQTFTDALKEKEEFTKEKQKEAFNKAVAAVYAALSDEALECLEYMVDDLQEVITQKIEAQVRKEKIRG